MIWVLSQDCGRKLCTADLLPMCCGSGLDTATDA